MPSIDTKYTLWKTRLLDLSRRNRLLYYREYKRSSARVVEPAANSIFQTLVIEEHKLTFAQNLSEQLAFETNPEVTTPDTISNTSRPLRAGEIRTNQSDDSLGTTLYNLRSRMRSALEEQGVHILFLAFGMLQWYESRSSTERIQTPLLLVPVWLDRPSVTRPYTLELTDDDPVMNPTLMYKLQTDFHLSLPTLPEDWSTSSLDEMLRLFSDAVRSESRWSIVQDVVLGLFSFEKLVMLKDLETHETQAKQHALIMALGGDISRIERPPSDLPRADELDAKVRPEDTFQVLDADSSQQEAIARAKRGVSLVIQGPPGTGKSQTIANLIAELLAQNKRILFVSEKQAALDVVYQRLKQLGLHEFCLKAHGHKANKTDILTQLGTALQNYQAMSLISDEELRTLADLRTQLNLYVQALHEPITTLQQAPFYVHGLLANLNDAPHLNFVLNSIERVDRVQLNAMVNAIEELGATSSAWQNYDTHPWRNTPIRAFSFQLGNDVRFLLSEAIEAAGAINNTCIQIATRLAIPAPQSLQEANIFKGIVSHVVKSPLPPQEWFGIVKLEEIRNALVQAQHLHNGLEIAQEKLSELTTGELLSFPDLSAMHLRFVKDYKSFLRIFNPSFKQDMQRIQATLKTSRNLRYGEARTLVEIADTVNTTAERIQENKDRWQLLFGRYYQGSHTNWEAAIQNLAWTENCLKLFGSTSISSTFVQIVCNQSATLKGLEPLVESLGVQLNRLTESFNKLNSILPPEKLNFDGLVAAQAKLISVQQRMQEQLAQVNRLQEWIQFDTIRAKLATMGLPSLVNSVIASQPNPNQLRSAFLKRFYLGWLDYVYSQKPILNLSNPERTRLVEQFRKSDNNQFVIARNRVQAQLRSQRPDPNLANARTSEVTVLRRELQRRRHRPIRKLFGDIPNLLPALTPCLMMSPLSVSMFLSGADFAFDAVIFDEASQVVPEDAIASILRAKQMVVAGDKNQLPPTSFFKTLGVTEETEEDDDTEILESILQESSSFLLDTYLKWHYRSRHESLIAFSNQNIYDNRLITFPSAVQKKEHLGVEFVHVPNGVYDRSHSRTNRVEARQVADLVFEHFAKYPNLTLGVVAFSEAQKHAIEEELERKVRQDLSFEKLLAPEGPCEFFVKNLESVQGDERDVMFFSIGYGKDAMGTFTLNFGPLNGENGVRRLNVAITRARLHVKLVSSIVPEDINLAASSRGIQLLRAYMEYVRAGGNETALHGALSLEPDAESDSPFEQAVYQELSNRGLVLHKQVGCSGYRIDLAVVDPQEPGRYLLGIECDGATYHSAKTARDRDRLRQQVLEKLGWKILRIWSRDWIADSNSQIIRVLDALNHRYPPTQIVARPDANPNTNYLNVEAPDFTFVERAPAAVIEPRPLTHSYLRIGQIEIEEICQAIINCLQREFSLSQDELVIQTARSLGFVRTTQVIKARIGKAIQRLIERNQIRIRNDKIELTH